MRMAALTAWLAACIMGHAHGSEEEDQDLRRSGRSTCTDALHDAATNIIATRKDRNNTFKADPASYPREIENRRETISPVIINDDAPMAAEARRIMLSSSSTLKNAQARLAASAQVAGANGKAGPSRCHHRGHSEKKTPLWNSHHQEPKPTNQSKAAGNGTQQARKAK